MRTRARARGPAPAPAGCAVSRALTPCPRCVWNKDFLLLVPDGPWAAPRGRCGGEWRCTGAWDALQATLHAEAVSQPEAAPVLVSKRREQQTPRLEPETGCGLAGSLPRPLPASGGLRWFFLCLHIMFPLHVQMSLFIRTLVTWHQGHPRELLVTGSSAEALLPA